MNSNREADAFWSIIGYLLSGLLFWGGAGWAADHYLFHTDKTFTLIGLLLGMGGAFYLIWLRFGRE